MSKKNFDKIGYSTSKVQDSENNKFAKDGKFITIKKIVCFSKNEGIHAFFPYFNSAEDEIVNSKSFHKDFFQTYLPLLEKKEGDAKLVKEEIYLLPNEFILSFVLIYEEEQKKITAIKVKTNFTSYSFGNKPELNKKAVSQITKAGNFIPGWKTNYILDEGLPYLSFLNPYFEEASYVKRYINHKPASKLNIYLRKKAKQCEYVFSTLFKIFLTLFLLISPFLYYYHTSQNIYGGEYLIPDNSLNNPVSIHTDANGIAHIKANNKEDGFYGLGFVHARERLWQMDFLRRMNNGRLSEIFGIKALAVDKMMRKLGFKNFVENKNNAFKKSKFIRLIERYVDGINFYAENNILPIEYILTKSNFEKWTIDDSLAVGCFFSWVYTHDWRMNVWYKLMEDNLGKEFAEMVVGFREKGFKFDQETIINNEELEQIKLNLGGNMQGYKTNIENPELRENRRQTEVHDPQNLQHTLQDEQPSKQQLQHSNEEKSQQTQPEENTNQRQTNDKSQKSQTQQSQQSQHHQKRNKSRQRIKHQDSVIDTLEFPNVNEGASNNWVISGQHTESGKPILANDPHIENSVPPALVIIKLYLPDITISGSVAPGIPLFINGSNNNLAWGITTENTSTSDLCEEKIEGDYYLYDGKKHKLDIVQEEIIIKDEQPVNIEVRYTKNGPLIDTIANDALRLNTDYTHYTPLSLRVYWMKFDFTVEYAFKLMFSKSKDDFVDDIEKVSAPNINFIYATTKGEIGYYQLGFIPIKKTIRNTFCQGYNPEDDIIRHVKREESLRLINPRKGFIVTANNKMATSNYKFDFPGYQNNIRAYRIREMIEEKIRKNEKINVATNIEIQMDTKDCLAEEILPKILRIVEKAGKSHLPYYNELKNWDYNMRKDSNIPTIYSILEFRLAKSLVSNNNIDENLSNGILSILHFWNFIDGIIEKMSRGELVELKQCAIFTGSTNCEKLIVYVFENLDSYLADFRDKNNNLVSWGTAKNNYFRHFPFEGVTYLKNIFSRRIETGGNRNTVKIARGHFNINNGKSNLFISNYSSTVKFVCDLSDINNPYIISNTGNSGNIFSKYYDNFLNKNENGELIKLENHIFEDNFVDLRTIVLRNSNNK